MFCERTLATTARCGSARCCCGPSVCRTRHDYVDDEDDGNLEQLAEDVDDEDDSNVEQLDSGSLVGLLWGAALPMLVICRAL